MAAGIDRAVHYMLRDVDPNSSTQYDSSGLVGTKGDWTPKISWYYVYTMKNRLKGMTFTGEQASGNPSVWIYKFRQSGGNSGAYVLWCPTSNGTSLDYQLTLTGAPSTLVTMTSGDTDGVPTALTMIKISSPFDFS